MRVSVVIPVHNDAGGLRESLAAVRSGLPGDGEIVVVDDGSTDDSAAVAGAMGARVVPLHVLHLGVGAAWAALGRGLGRFPRRGR